MRYEDKLRQRVADQQAAMQQSRDEKEIIRHRSKEYRAFLKLPEKSDMDFWCRFCAIDFRAPAWKEWCSLDDTGTWRSYCPLCEEHVYRHITEKTEDPYYDESVKVRLMRGHFEADTLRPEDYGFNTLYGDGYAQHHASFEEQDRMIHERYSALGLKGESLKERDEREKIREAFGLM